MNPVMPAIRRVVASRTGAITAAVFIAFAFELAPAALAQTVPASATTATTAFTRCSIFHALVNELTNSSHTFFKLRIPFNILLFG